MSDTVLVVEDDNDLRDWIVYELEADGYSVQAVCDGVEAIQTAEISHSLILLDVQLPKLSGFEVCQQLRMAPNTADIPVIFLTACSGLDDKLTGFESGGIDYITKPFSMTELKARMKAVLRTRTIERERAEKRLEKYKAELAQNLSHELRTPMSIILGALDIMDHTVAQKNLNELNSVLNTAHLGAYRLYWMIQDLLMVNKLAQKQVPAFHSPTELLNAVETVVDQLRMKYATYDIKIEVDVSGAETVYMLHTHLTDVLRHLIDNGCKFSNRGGTVRIKVVSLGKNGFKILVQDAGVGISPDYFDLIFERFYQIDMSATRPAQGMGIGLFVVKQLADLYGGETTVMSEEGTGSVFSFSMPPVPDNNDVHNLLYPK